MAIFNKLKNVIELHDPKTGELIEMDNKPFLLLCVDAGSEDYENGEFHAIRGRAATLEFFVMPQSQLLSDIYSLTFLVFSVDDSLKEFD